MRVHRIDLAAHLFATPEAAAAALVRSALASARSARSARLSSVVCAFRLWRLFVNHAYLLTTTLCMT